jgi:hypothetical protein
MARRRCYVGINLAPAEFKEGGMLSSAKELSDDKTHSDADDRHIPGAIAARPQEDTDNAAMMRQWEQCNRTVATKMTPA